MSRHPRSTRIALVSALLALAPPLAAGQAQPAAGDPEPLTLVAALDRALAASPELAAAAAAVAAREGALLRASAWASPELEIERENFAVSGAAEVEQTTALLSQRLEPFGTRRPRRDAASADLAAARAELARLRLELTAAVERGFVTVLGMQRAVELEVESARTAGEVMDAVASLVAAGAVAPAEEARARAAAERARIDELNARRDLDLERRALAALWGAAEPDFAAAAGELAADAAPLDAGALEAGIAGSPLLAALDAAVAAAEARGLQARRQRLPELTVSAGYRRFAGAGEGWVASLALPLPLAGGRRGARAEAEALTAQARSERAAAQARLRAELGATVVTLRAAAAEAASLRGAVLPPLEETFAAVAEGYRAGKLGLLDLLEARRTLSGARRDHLDAVVRLNLALAELRRFMPVTHAEPEGVLQ